MAEEVIDNTRSIFSQAAAVAAVESEETPIIEAGVEGEEGKLLFHSSKTSRKDAFN